MNNDRIPFASNLGEKLLAYGGLDLDSIIGD
jgi:hypothetical protein